MSLTFGFYNAVNGDRTYDALDMSRFLDGLVCDGIYEHVGKKFEVKAKSGMNITVGTGRAWFQHTWTHLSAESASTPDVGMTLTVAAGGASARTDCVVLEVNTTNETSANGTLPRSNRIYILQNTPWYRVTRGTQEGVYRYPLAELSIPANAWSIEQVTIDNKLGKKYEGTVYTPIVTGVLETVDLSTQLSSAEQQIRAAVSETQTSGRNQFSSWFNGFKTSSNAQVAGLMSRYDDQLNTFYNNFVSGADSELLALLNEALNQARNLRIFSGDVPTASGEGLTLTGEFHNTTTQTDFYPPSRNLQTGDYLIGANGYLAKITHLVGGDDNLATITSLSLEGTGISFGGSSSGSSDIPVVNAASQDGASYYGSSVLPAEIRTVGKQIIFIPGRTSTAKLVMLNLTVTSGDATQERYDPIYIRSGVNQQAYKSTAHKARLQGPVNDWLLEGIPYLLTYGSNCWYLDSYIDPPRLRLFTGNFAGSGFYYISDIVPFDGFKNGDYLFNPAYGYIKKVSNYDFTIVNNQVYFTPLEVSTYSSGGGSTS